MMFKIEITETLQKTIVVNADDAEAAIIFARRLYSDEKIVLDYRNYIGADFNTVTYR